jgi:hypothetical protein
MADHTYAHRAEQLDELFASLLQAPPERTATIRTEPELGASG